MGIFPEPNVERGRTLSRISVAKGSTLNFRGRKSNSLMNLCGKSFSLPYIIFLFFLLSLNIFVVIIIWFSVNIFVLKYII